MEYGRRGTGGWALSLSLEGAREGTQPTTQRRFSEAFKLGIYTVDDQVPRCAWCQGIGQTPCTRL